MRTTVQESERKAILSPGVLDVAIREALRVRPEGLKGVRIYGSVTRPGKFRADSDIDVGLVFAREDADRAEAIAAQATARGVRVLGHLLEFHAMYRHLWWYRFL